MKSTPSVEIVSILNRTSSKEAPLDYLSEAVGKDGEEVEELIAKLAEKQIVEIDNETDLVKLTY